MFTELCSILPEEVNRSLAIPPLEFNGGLVKPESTSLENRLLVRNDFKEGLKE